MSLLTSCLGTLPTIFVFGLFGYARVDNDSKDPRHLLIPICRFVGRQISVVGNQCVLDLLRSKEKWKEVKLMVFSLTLAWRGMGNGIFSRQSWQFLDNLILVNANVQFCRQTTPTSVAGMLWHLLPDWPRIPRITKLKRTVFAVQDGRYESNDLRLSYAGIVS